MLINNEQNSHFFSSGVFKNYQAIFINKSNIRQTPGSIERKGTDTVIVGTSMNSLTYQGIRKNSLNANQTSFGNDTKNVKKRDTTLIETAQPEKLKVISSLGKGVVQPFVEIFDALVKNPVMSALVIGVTATAMRRFKLVGTALTTGIAGLGAYKMASGAYNARKAVKTEKAKEKDQNYAEANKQIREIGEGFTDIALTAYSAVEGLKSLVKTTKAVASAKDANSIQKTFAVLKQFETKSQVMKSPKTMTGVRSKLKKEFILDLNKFKNILNNTSKSKVKPSTLKITDVIKDPEQKAQLVNFLKNASEYVDKTKLKGKVDLSQLISRLESANEIKLSAGESKQLGLLLETFKSADEIPPVLRMFRSIVKTVNESDDVGKILAKQIKTTRTGEATTQAAVVSAESLRDER